ncbi:MAG: hypothetical protein L0170_10270, partial [Acidobacteria bacterium]|nr:hypothetical protein [Acidobacteriota bacterium]
AVVAVAGAAVPGIVAEMDSAGAPVVRAGAVEAGAEVEAATASADSAVAVADADAHCGFSLHRPSRLC